jgi:leucyl-tRNA synthetase
MSRLQEHIEKTTTSLENFQTRQALQEAFFSIENDLKWYRRRLPEGSDGSRMLRSLCSGWIRLLAPFIPFTCEKLWQDIGGQGLVSFADWPVVDQKQQNRRIELAEELLLRTVEDLESITKLIQITPKSITILLAAAWKHEIFTTIARAPDRNLAIRTIMKDDRMRRRGREASDATKQCTNLIHRLPPHTVELIASEGVNERAVFEQAAPFLEKEFGVPVHIVEAKDSRHPKAATALPFKPAIVIE